VARARATTIEVIRSEAATLFQRQGYRKTSLEDIAKAVGVSKPTLYTYVDSKLELLEQIVAEVMVTLDEGLMSILDNQDTAEAKLRASILLQSRAAAEQRNYYQLLFSEQPDLSDTMQDRINEWARSINHRYAKLIDQCRADGIISSDIDPSVAANLILGMMTSVSRWYRHRNRFSPEEIGDQAFRLIALQPPLGS
jgi:AcrR family transcriptional regulator